MAAKDSPGRLSDQRTCPADLVEEVIVARRSIRRYTDRPVPEAWIEAILRCGAQAPSPSNSQPVRMVRIASQDLRDDLDQALSERHARLLRRNQEKGGDAKLRNRINAYRRYAAVMVQAPVLLAVGTTAGVNGFAGRLQAAGLMGPDPRQGHDALISVGLALSGMLLKAQALGLGTCILTAPLVFIRDMARMLGLPGITIQCLLALGFAAETPPVVPRLPLDAVYTVL